jgi:antibiotic biosynthesis monooxygenase (ABM) superfamily enzyme
MLAVLIAEVVVCLGVAWLLIDPYRRMFRDWLNQE